MILLAVSIDLDLKHVLEESFDSIDLNHDGYLSQDEVSQALAKLGLNRSRAPVSFCSLIFPGVTIG